jgi:hypothetical protein
MIPGKLHNSVKLLIENLQHLSLNYAKRFSMSFILVLVTTRIIYAPSSLLLIPGSIKVGHLHMWFCKEEEMLLFCASKA